MRMHFDTCAVKTYRFQLDMDYIFPLKHFKKMLKNSIFAPAFEEGVHFGSSGLWGGPFGSGESGIGQAALCSRFIELHDGKLKLDAKCHMKIFY